MRWEHHYVKGALANQQNIFPPGRKGVRQDAATPSEPSESPRRKCSLHFASKGVELFVRRSLLASYSSYRSASRSLFLSVARRSLLASYFGYRSVNCVKY